LGSASAGPSGNGNGHADPNIAATSGLVGLFLQTLLAERTCFANGESAELTSLKELTNRLTRETLANMPCASGGAAIPAKVAAKEIAAAN
jgi:hypothetical protein